MACIALPDGLPGISAGLRIPPGDSQNQIANWLHILLDKQGSLAPGERELFATYVSPQNDSYFCQTAAAVSDLGGEAHALGSATAAIPSVEFPVSLRTRNQGLRNDKTLSKLPRTKHRCHPPASLAGGSEARASA